MYRLNLVKAMGPDNHKNIQKKVGDQTIIEDISQVLKEIYELQKDKLEETILSFQENN